MKVTTDISNLAKDIADQAAAAVPASPGLANAAGARKHSGVEEEKKEPVAAIVEVKVEPDYTTQ